MLLIILCLTWLFHGQWGHLLRTHYIMLQCAVETRSFLKINIMIKIVPIRVPNTCNEREIIAIFFDTTDFINMETKKIHYRCGQDWKKKSYLHFQWQTLSVPDDNLMKNLEYKNGHFYVILLQCFIVVTRMTRHFGHFIDVIKRRYSNHYCNKDILLLLLDCHIECIMYCPAWYIMTSFYRGQKVSTRRMFQRNKG